LKTDTQGLPLMTILCLNRIWALTFQAMDDGCRLECQLCQVSVLCCPALTNSNG